jgi:hypothetical protein
MIVELLSILPLIQAADSALWNRLPDDGDGAYAYRLADAGAAGDIRRVVLKATPHQRRDWASMELVYDVACGGQTMTMLSVRTLDAAGVELQAVAIPEDRRDAEPMYAGETGSAALYAELCPHGAPLATRVAPPPPMPTPRRR